MKSGTITTAPNTETVVARTLTPAIPRLGGGLTLEYAASQRLLVSADVLYRYFAYTAETDTGTTLADGTSQGSTVIEYTHARYYDLPILARFTTRPARTAAAQALVGAGVSFRRASNIRTTTNTTSSDSSASVSYTPRTPLNRTAYGVMASLGFRVKDDFGIKVTPEVRYIRWLSPLFSGWPAEQRRNELQVVIGITF
jgi:hypothetical protein